MRFSGYLDIARKNYQSMRTEKRILFDKDIKITKKVCVKSGKTREENFNSGK
jgi:hypothetical protein